MSNPAEHRSEVAYTSVSGRAPESVFHNRNFMLLWCAYGVSALGDHLSEMALLKTQDALDATNLTQLLAKITFVFMLPFFVLGPVAGLLADRLPRRGLMIAADLIRAAIMFCFAWLVATSEAWGPWGPYLPLGLVGVFAAVFSPARAALLPTLIRPRQLIEANATMSGLGVIATMLSAVLGGYLATHYAPTVAFRLDATTFIFSAALLFCIRPPQRSTHAIPAGEPGTWRALREGFVYVARHRRVAELLLVAVLVWSTGAVVRSTIPAVVRDAYGLHSYFAITVFQALLGAGMLSGALVLTLFGDALRSEVAITLSLTGIGVAMGLLAGSVWLPATASVAMGLGGTAIVLAGIGATGVMASYQALMQRIVPDRVRGRVFGVTDLCTMAGLLAATGALGIPAWPTIDRWVGVLLVTVAVTLLAAGLTTWLVRRRRSSLSVRIGFWRGLTDFYCRWWFRLRRDGICTIPREGPVLVVANHTCSVDPLLLIASSTRPYISFLIAQEFHSLPVFGRLTRMIECIPVQRDGRDSTGTRAALRHLQAGKVLGIFLEGRIPAPNEDVPPRHGAAMLALHSEAVVIPAHISGTRYHPGVAWSFLQRHRARVRFGKPIDLSGFYAHRRDRTSVEAVSRLMMATIRELAPPT